MHLHEQKMHYTFLFFFIFKKQLISYCVQDLLYVISYGPSQVKPPAVQMLFHYWPNLKPPGAISEYRGLQYTGQDLTTLPSPHLVL